MKNLKKLLAALLMMVMVISMVGCANTKSDKQTDAQTAAQTSAAEETTVDDGKIDVSLRIESVEKCDYYETVHTGAATLAELLNDLVELNAFTLDLTTSDYGTYVNGVNDVKAAHFGGWDGWLYRVNGVDASVGVDGTELKDGDIIVFYYGDPYGVGMQFPEYTVEGLTVSFTSQDATYDADGNVSVAVCPVANMEVTIGDFVGTTDENGTVTLPEGTASGSYAISVNRTSDIGCPTVLRLPADATITIQ